MKQANLSDAIVLGTYAGTENIVSQTTFYCDDPVLRPYLTKPWVRAWIAQRIGTPLITANPRLSGAATLSHEVLGRHSFVCGATGSGKSRAILLLVREHLARGGSVVLVDPKGETAENILAFAIADGVPPTSTVILDTRREAGVPGWNPLTTDVPLAQAVSDFVSLLAATHTSSWGPRLADCLTNALLVIASHRLSIFELTRFLAREDYREHLLARPVSAAGDPYTYREARAYFENEFAAWGRGERTQAVAPVLNKTRELLRSPFLRSLVCAQTNTLDLGELWHEPRLVILRLDRSALGEDAMRVLSGMLTHLLFRTALRARGGRKVLLCVDELPVLARYVGDVLEDILAVARSMGLRLLVACQHLAQISGSLRASLLANTAAQLFFRLGPEDARLVASHLAVGTDQALTRATITADGEDPETGLPYRSQWRQPVFDAEGRRLRLDPEVAEALRWRDLLGSDPIGDLDALGKLAGTRRLYVVAPDTGKPTPLGEYVGGISPTEYWFEGPALELVLTFPRPRITRAERTSEADATRLWWRRLAELPVQHAVLQSAGDAGRLIRLRNVAIPTAGPARRKAFLDASFAEFGQSKGCLRETLEAREREIERIAAGAGAPVTSPLEQEEEEDASIF